MSVPVNPAFSKPAARWNYVEVEVLDGERVLHPTHIAFDRLIFSEPPNLSSEFVQVVITNNGESHSSQVRVLPHDNRSSTHIPIQLIESAQTPSARLTA